MLWYERGGGVAKYVQLLPDTIVCVSVVMKAAVCQKVCTQDPVSIGLVTAIQLMVAEMKGTPAVHCCLEVDQPQKTSCHKIVSTCLAVCSRSRSADLDQLRVGKLSALNTQIFSNEGPAM